MRIRFSEISNVLGSFIYFREIKRTASCIAVLREYASEILFCLIPGGLGFIPDVKIVEIIDVFAPVIFYLGRYVA